MDPSRLNHLKERGRRAVRDGAHALFRTAPLEAMLSRFTQDREVSSFIGKLAPGNTSYAPSSLREVTRGGIRFRLDISDYQEWLVYWGLRTDCPAALYDLLRAGAVVADVGSNIGDVCLKAASLVGPAGKVFAFEPDPLTYRKLTGNLALNDFSNIVASNLALGERPGTLAMKIDCAGNRGGNRIAARDDDGAESFPVQVDTLDGFVDRAKLARLDVVKIDVEGFEMSVLRGARACLQRLRPSLFVEVADGNLRPHGTSAAELLSYVRGLGYRTFHAMTGQELREGDVPDPYFDAVCRPV